MITGTMVISALTSSEVIKVAVMCGGALVAVGLSKLCKIFINTKDCKNVAVALAIILIGIAGEMLIFSAFELNELLILLGDLFHLS